MFYRYTILSALVCLLVLSTQNLCAENKIQDTDTNGLMKAADYNNCVLDSDCQDNETCKDDGRCVPLQCETDDDCIYDDLLCRVEDKQCALKECRYDADCLSYQICLSKSCTNDPTTYVEGGAGNCTVISVVRHWDQLAMLVICLLLLLFIRLKGNRE